MEVPIFCSTTAPEDGIEKVIFPANTRTTVVRKSMLKKVLRDRHRTGTMAASLLIGALAIGCGDSTEPEPDRTPTITITGVADGETVAGPVTIGISVDVGTYTAELNGETFFAGRTVSDPGEYTLTVDARNGTATASVTVQFTILLAGSSRLILRVIDLGPNEAGGGGDALLLTDSSAAGLRHALIDAGPAGVGGSDPGFVQRRLTQLGVDTLDALVLTHAHSDHFGGMTAILQDVVVRRFFYNAQARTFTAYNQLITLAQQTADTVIVPDSPFFFVLGFGADATQVTVLTALGNYLNDAGAGSSEINEGSLGTEVVKGTFRLFVAGDGEVGANLRWRTLFGAETANVTALKVGHHGANDAVFDNGFSGSSAWLNHTEPELALVSANGTTHPRVNALNALLALPGTVTRCTNTHGDIEVRVNDVGGYVTDVERNDDTLCSAGSEATS